MPLLVHHFSTAALITSDQRRLIGQFQFGFERVKEQDERTLKKVQIVHFHSHDVIADVNLADESKWLTVTLSVVQKYSNRLEVLSL